MRTREKTGRGGRAPVGVRGSGDEATGVCRVDIGHAGEGNLFCGPCVVRIWHRMVMGEVVGAKVIVPELW